MSMNGREELKEVLINLKSDGYSLKDRKKSTKTIDLLVNSGRIPKKSWLRIDIRKVPSKFIQRWWNWFSRKIKRIIIMIIHRISTVISSDKIIELENGCIKSYGSYSHVLETSSSFRSLVQNSKITNWFIQFWDLSIIIKNSKNKERIIRAP